MNLKGRMCVAMLIPMIAIAGGSDIVQISPDTYMLVKQNRAGIFGSISRTKIKAIQEANEFADSQGKIAIPISTTERPITRPAQWPTVEYQFRVVDRNDPEAQRTSLTPRPDLVVNVEGSPQPYPQNTPPSSPNEDMYSRLLKLDDLRNRGIITDAEFEKQKQKLLSAP